MAYIGIFCPGVAGVCGRGGVAEGRGGIRGVNSFADTLRVNSLALGLREEEAGGLPLSGGDPDGAP